MMTQHIIQKGLRRGRWANLVGLMLFVALLAVLVLAVVQGVTGLRSA